MLTFRQFLVNETTLHEGGAMFSDRRITKAEVPPTIDALEALTGLSLHDNMVGSTGISDTSGDIDVIVDTATLSKDQFIAQLRQAGVAPADMRKTGIEVAVRAPIYRPDGTKTDDFIQVDFLFHKDPPYLKWFYGGVQPSPYKNVDKNRLLSGLAKIKGYILSMNGLLDRDTRAVVSLDPPTIARTLFGPRATAQDLLAIPTILSLAKAALPADALADTLAHVTHKRGKPFEV